MANLGSMRDKLQGLPNKLTLARIAVIPLLLLIYPARPDKFNVFCSIVFAAGMITDLLDGYLARRYQLVTPLGALLDPIADKMLIATSLVMLAAAGKAPAFIAGLLIARDIGVNGIRLVALEEGRSIEVSDFGKWKTAVMGLSIFCLFYQDSLFGISCRAAGIVLLWASLILSLYSAWLYGRAYLATGQNPPAT